MSPRPYESAFGGPEEESISPAPIIQDKVPTTPPVRPPRRKPHSITGPNRLDGQPWLVVQAFAELLQRERARRKWDMTETAAFLGLHLTQYRRYENGGTAPTIRAGNKICRRLGVQFDLGEYAE